MPRRLLLVLLVQGQGDLPVSKVDIHAAMCSGLVALAPHTRTGAVNVAVVEDKS